MKNYLKTIGKKNVIKLFSMLLVLILIITAGMMVMGESQTNQVAEAGEDVNASENVDSDDNEGTNGEENSSQDENSTSKNDSSSNSTPDSDNNSDDRSESNGGNSSSSSSEETAPAPVPPPSNDITVYVSATCKVIIDNQSSLPPELVRVAGSGTLVGSTPVTLTKGSTAIDASNAVGIFGSAGYVSSIKGVNEGAAGGSFPLSGWKYSVNGSFPNVGASQYELSDGDVIRWGYTLDGHTGY